MLKCRLLLQKYTCLQPDAKTVMVSIANSMLRDNGAIRELKHPAVFVLLKHFNAAFSDTLQLVMKLIAQTAHPRSLSA